jgi:hypothetical protein
LRPFVLNTLYLTAKISSAFQVVNKQKHKTSVANKATPGFMLL